MSRLPAAAELQLVCPVLPFVDSERVRAPQIELAGSDSSELIRVSSFSSSVRAQCRNTLQHEPGSGSCWNHNQITDAAAVHHLLRSGIYSFYSATGRQEVRTQDRKSGLNGKSGLRQEVRVQTGSQDSLGSFCWVRLVLCVSHVEVLQRSEHFQPDWC